MTPVIKSFSYHDTFTSPDQSSRRVVFKHDGGRSLYVVVKMVRTNVGWQPISFKVWTGDFQKTIASWRTSVSDNERQFMSIMETRSIVDAARAYMAWITEAIAR